MISCAVINDSVLDIKYGGHKNIMNLLRHNPKISIQLHSSNKTNISAGMNRLKQFPVGCCCGQKVQRQLHLQSSKCSPTSIWNVKASAESLNSHSSADAFFQDIF